MFRNKNYTPSQLALLSASAIGLVTAAVVFGLERNWILISLTTLLVFICSYIIILYVLNQFIYRKIKLIYKLISQTKASRREEFYQNELLPRKSIQEIQQQVEEWSVIQNKEIEALRSNESFRKEFLLNLTHELKTPIFACQNYIETLVDGALYDNTVNKLFLGKASNSMNRLVSLVEDLDVISKYESNAIPLKKEDFIIQDIIKEVYNELQFQSSEKNIRSRIKIGCENPVHVFADQNKIRQVLINLVENAIKYGRMNGEITAGVYPIDSNQILVEITDNGSGIAEDQVPRIFERFYRTDHARSRKIGGSGLGLSIVKHIIEAHQGHVFARSSLDIGTTIGFVLPNTVRE